jgi:hypothetical protein
VIYVELFFWQLETQSSPYINRFLQPDTVIPDLSNPQSWNRYSYVTNRPVNFNDPTGHTMTQGDGGCTDEVDCALPEEKLQEELDNFESPELVDPNEMVWFGTWLAPGEAEMFVMKEPAPFGNYSYSWDFYRLAKMKQIWKNADDATSLLFYEYDPKGEMNNSPSGAFHHAYWSALITREFGADFANQFLYAHETRPKSFKEETFMDLHNNQIGINIALANSNATDAELQAVVLDSLYLGELYVWDGENIYFSGPQCLGCNWRPK